MYQVLFDADKEHSKQESRSSPGSIRPRTTGGYPANHGFAVMSSPHGEETSSIGGGGTREFAASFGQRRMRLLSAEHTGLIRTRHACVDDRSPLTLEWDLMSWNTSVVDGRPAPPPSESHAEICARRQESAHVAIQVRGQSDVDSTAGWFVDSPTIRALVLEVAGHRSSASRP